MNLVQEQLTNSKYRRFEFDTFSGFQDKFIDFQAKKRAESCINSQKIKKIVSKNYWTKNSSHMPIFN